MSETPRPKVRLTWNISYDCNYRCSYCFFDGKWEEYKQRNIYLSVDDWVKHWKRMQERYGDIVLIITGGEPFIYPNFVELIRELSKICFHINISTNSSQDLQKFVETIDPEKVSISLSFQREFDSLLDFIERVKLVRRHGFKGCLNLVAYPPFLQHLEEDNKKLFAETGEEFKIIPFFGRYKDQDYPQAYTEEERKIVGIDEKWFNQVRRKGSLCSAGHSSVLVFPDGKVARCGQVGERILLGNFLDPELKLYDRAMECDAEYCPCQEDSIDGDGQKSACDKNNNSTKKDLKMADNQTAISSLEDKSEKALSKDSNKLLPSNGGIKFAWDIHYKCNFRCPYCWFYKDWARLASRSVYLSPDEWMVHWKRIYDKYGEVRIEIVGGEPFIYPNFIELVKKLSALHSVKITTNLSGDIERFVQEIDPKRVDLDLNFHILFIDLETVIKKTHMLNNAGFKAGVCYLAYPPQMHKIKYLSERFKNEGINFALAAFWGEHNGKKYPDAYTEEEREMMRPYLGDIARVTYHLNAKSPRDKLCKAGFRYADIQADGNVVRCSPLADKSIGNIMDDNFQLLEQPCPCDSDSCSSNEYDNLIEETKVEDHQEVVGKEPEKQPEKEAAIKITSQSQETPADSLAKVKYPRLVPPYRVHWNWELGLSCNYKCSYCEVWPKGRGEKHSYIDVKTWKEIWDKMFEKYWCCQVRFSGGEPTIYPNFFEIASEMLKKHSVDITTNLSFDVKAFARQVKPGGLSISASFHPEYNKIEDFLERVAFLHFNGYPSTIAYVAYPPHLKDIQAAKELVEKKRIMFKIIPFKGEFAGKKYPDAYTKEEKILIEGFSADSQDAHLNDLNQRWYYWNVKQEKEKRQKMGSLCRMGQMYAKILPDGRVMRCCALDKNGKPLGILGQITDLNLRLLDEPVPCEAENCPCFKSMLVGYEEDKWLPLWEGAQHPLYKIEDARKFAEAKNAKVESPKINIISEEKKELLPALGPKSDRSLVVPNRVFVTWDIHYACNYRCEYCFFCKKWDEVAKENKYPGLDTWEKIWDDFYKKYGSAHIHVSGGEPFTYPDFMDLVVYLTENHTIEFDTNLSFDVDEFISKVSPGRVKFATAFHPGFANFKVYFEKVLKLKECGFDIGINYVAFPKQLSQMKEYKKAFDKEHISFTIMPFRGEFEGRAYPQGYTDEEKALIIECDSNLTVSSKMIEWYGKDKLQRRGVVCRMGQMYTKVHPNGEAFRCCFINDNGKLGNLIEGTFALWDEPKLCEYPECPCWTAMVIGTEGQWQDHWVIPQKPEVFLKPKPIDMELE